MSLRDLFTQHPREVNETYMQHARVAGTFAVKLLLASLAVAVHSVLPFLFTRTASTLVARLHDEMVTNRQRR